MSTGALHAGRDLHADRQWDPEEMVTTQIEMARNKLAAASKDLRHPQSETAGPTVGTASDQTEPPSAVNATNTTGYGTNGPRPLLWGLSQIVEGVTRLLWRLFL